MATQVQHEPAPYRLSRWQRYSCLAFLLGLFFFGNGKPVWRNPFDVDWHVWASYLPIPFLVLGCLLYSRRLSGVAMFLNTLELTLVKFGITYCFAIGMWALSDGPPPRPEWQPSMKLPAAAPAPPGPEPAPSVTPWPAQRTATLSGHVTRPDGTPAAGALVYVAKGLEQLQSAVPEETAVIDVEADSTDRLFVAREYQPLAARSADGRMHNLVASAGERVLFNVPLLAGGQKQALKPPPAARRISLRCMVHAAKGWHAELLLLNSPHFTRSDSHGRYTLTGVPAVPLTLTAIEPGTGAITSTQLRPSDGATVSAPLQLNSSPAAAPPSDTK